MTEPPLNHPSDEALRALSEGQLAEADFADISAHLGDWWLWSYYIQPAEFLARRNVPETNPAMINGSQTLTIGSLRKIRDILAMSKADGPKASDRAARQNGSPYRSFRTGAACFAGDWISFFCGSPNWMEGKSTLIARTSRSRLMKIIKPPISIGPDGTWLASASGDEDRLRIWDVDTARVRKEIPLPEGTIRALTVSPDGTRAHPTLSRQEKGRTGHRGARGEKANESKMIQAGTKAAVRKG